jgi:hypothetical protein
MTPIEFVAYYEKYLIGDIDTMMEKADQESEGNQMAVPITFSIFSCLDIFGFLMRNIEDQEKKVKSELTNSKQNISYSILKWNDFGFSNDEIQNHTDILLKFIEIYRHGIMHTFFPKSFSISNIKEAESKELFYKVDNDLVFNVRKFYLCFRNFIEKFEQEITTNEFFNKKIEDNINLVFKSDSSFDDFYENISKIEHFNQSSENEIIGTTDIISTISPSQNMNNSSCSITSSFKQTNN